MKTYQAYLFDWDNTLAQTAEVWVQEIQRGLARNGIVETEKEIARNLGDLTWFTHFGLPSKALQTMLTSMREAANARLADVPLYDDTKDVLQALHAAGKKLAVVTAAEKSSIDILLDRHDVRRYFDAIITQENTSTHKPDPEGLNLALQKLGAQPQQAVMVGDNYKDILAAQNAHIDSVLFFSEDHRLYYDFADLQSYNPTFVITSLRELVQ